MASSQKGDAASSQKGERQARQAAEAKVAWADYHAQRAATDKNTERLRAQRLAREARQPLAEPPKKKAKKKGKPGK